MEDTLTCSHATFSQVFGRQGQLMQARWRVDRLAWERPRRSQASRATAYPDEYEYEYEYEKTNLCSDAFLQM
ncbi:hypothetical protein CRENBAI_021410, partial [Crenichthys baileyi]